MNRAHEFAIGGQSYFWTNNVNPIYDPREKWPDFETKKFCRKIKSERIQFLKNNLLSWDDLYDRDLVNDTGRASRGHQAHNTRINKALFCLRSCKRNQRCLNPICPTCARRYRVWGISNALSAMAPHGPLLFVTWVPEPKPFAPAPTVHDLKNMRDGFIRRIKRKCGTSVIGFGWCDIAIRTRLDCLVPHVHVLLANTTKPEVQRIRGELKDHRIIYRPLEVKAVKEKDSVEVMSYALKQFAANRSRGWHKQIIYGKPDQESSKSERRQWLNATYPPWKPRRPYNEHAINKLLLMSEMNFAELAIPIGVARNNSTKLRVNIKS